MKRKPVRLALIALGAAAALVLIVAWAMLPTRYETDSVTVSEPDVPDATAPEAGTFQRMWKRPVTVRPDGARPSTRSLAGIGVGQLLALESNRIQAYDLNTGKPSWHYAQPGRVLDGVRVTDGGVVAEFREAGDSYDTDTSQLVGLDPATGERLWAKDESWSFVSTPDSIDPAAGVLVFRDGADRALGVRAATGEIAWDLPADHVETFGCQAHNRGADNDRANPEPLAVFTMNCGASGTEVTVAVGAESREFLWTRPAGDSYRTSGGFTMVTDAGTERVRVLAADGSIVYRAGTENCNGCALLADGDRTVVVHDVPDETEQFRVAVFDDRSARPSAFTVRRGSPMSDPVAAGGRLYVPVQRMVDHGLANPLVDLAVIDLDAGTSAMSPLPMFGVGMPIGRDGQGFPRVLDAAGGRLIVSNLWSYEATTMKATISAYEQLGTARPVELGGVRPDEWPRACDLLAKVPRGLAGGTLPDGERVRLESAGTFGINGIDIPEPYCTAHIPSVGEIELAVLWVTATEAEAEALLPKPVDGTGTRYVRLGRVLMQVSAGSTSRETARLVDLVRSELPAELAGDR